MGYVGTRREHKDHAEGEGVESEIWHAPMSEGLISEAQHRRLAIPILALHRADDT